MELSQLNIVMVLPVILAVFHQTVFNYVKPRLCQSPYWLPTTLGELVYSLPHLRNWQASKVSTAGQNAVKISLINIVLLIIIQNIYYDNNNIECIWSRCQLCKWQLSSIINNYKPYLTIVLMISLIKCMMYSTNWLRVSHIWWEQLSTPWIFSFGQYFIPDTKTMYMTTFTNLKVPPKTIPSSQTVLWPLLAFLTSLVLVTKLRSYNHAPHTV